MNFSYKKLLFASFLSISILSLLSILNTVDLDRIGLTAQVGLSGNDYGVNDNIAGDPCVGDPEEWFFDEYDLECAYSGFYWDDPDTGELVNECICDLVTHNVTFNAGTGGTVEGTDSQSIETGMSSSAVTAVPNSGYTFLNWTGDIATTTSNPLTVTNIIEDKSITANFTQLEYTVTFGAGEGGTIEGTASQEVEEGQSSSAVTAVPNSGYTFLNWTGDIATTTENPLTIIDMTEDKSVTANFSSNPSSNDYFTVTFDAGVGGTIEGAASQDIEKGRNSKPVAATPDSGYAFTNWTGDAATTTLNPLTITEVNKDISLTANFSNNICKDQARQQIIIPDNRLNDFNKKIDDKSLKPDYDFVIKQSLAVSKDWVDTNIKPLNKGVAKFLNNKSSQELLTKLINTMANYYICDCRDPQDINNELLSLQNNSLASADYALEANKGKIKNLPAWMINTFARITRNKESKLSTLYIIIGDQYNKGVFYSIDSQLEEATEAERKKFIEELPINLRCERAKELNPDWANSYTYKDLIDEI